MLHRLAFTNFKTWSEVDLACGRVTGLFGTNSSGKTSLLQFLLLLKQTKEATDRALPLALNGPYVELGTIGDAIHRHDEARAIHFDLEFDAAREVALSAAQAEGSAVIARGQRVSLSAEIAVRDHAPFTRRLSYGLGDMHFGMDASGSKEDRFELTARGGGADFRFSRTQGRPWPLPGPVKSYGFPDQARTYYQNAMFLADLEAAYEAAIDRVFYLGPLRTYPQRDYLWTRSRPTDVGPRGEKAIDAILSATAADERQNLKHRSPRLPFQQVIAHWLRHMGLIEGLTVKEIAQGSNRWQAKVITRAGGSETLLTDVGFGVSQVLPVVTLLHYVPEGSTVILEQPEIHLHPLAQAGLADVIMHAAVHRRVQVILESHSEHMLLRLQTRIAEAAAKAEDVKLYFCDAPKGTSVLHPLELDIFGNIRNWPDKFMGDAFGEAARAERARLKRMQAAAE